MVWLVLVLSVAVVALVVDVPRHLPRDMPRFGGDRARRPRAASAVPGDPRVAQHADAIRKSRPAR